jgi:hypothetical protein
MFQNAEKFMKEFQEKQAIDPRPETTRLYGPNCMVNDPFGNRIELMEPLSN